MPWSCWVAMANQDCCFWWIKSNSVTDLPAICRKKEKTVMYLKILTFIHIVCSNYKNTKQTKINRFCRKNRFLVYERLEYFPKTNNCLSHCQILQTCCWLFQKCIMCNLFVVIPNEGSLQQIPGFVCGSYNILIFKNLIK